jgi:hypothetical protein
LRFIIIVTTANNHINNRIQFFVHFLEIYSFSEFFIFWN